VAASASPEYSDSIAKLITESIATVMTIDLAAIPLLICFSNGCVLSEFQQLNVVDYCAKKLYLLIIFKVNNVIQKKC
jgi:hypothetical protein